jgi:hypothetical protein
LNLAAYRTVADDSFSGVRPPSLPPDQLQLDNENERQSAIVDAVLAQLSRPWLFWQNEPTVVVGSKFGRTNPIKPTDSQNDELYPTVAA